MLGPEQLQAHVVLCGVQGLGKTITGLALISKTRGTIPTPPAGPDGTPVKCTWVKDSTGRPAAFYTGTHSLLLLADMVGFGPHYQPSTPYEQ